jgi:hypothetical protein
VSLPAAVQLAVVALVFAVAFVAGRRVETPDGVVSVPTWVQVLLTGLGLGGPWILHARGLLTVGLVDDTIAALALSLALYLGAVSLVGTGRDSRGAC